MMIAVAAKDLNVVIDDVQILSGITVGIPEGQVVGLLGPSGSGKTTLMRTIVGLQRPKSGHITVLGQNAGTTKLRREVGYMTQATSVYNDLTVAENLSYFRALLGVSKDREKESMTDVSISELGKRLVGSLSGGERARVSLAIAMLGKPQLLILDEPTVGLDPLLRNQLWKMFNTLAQNGTTLLISSHVMDEASRCDSLLLLREGMLLASGTPTALMADTKTHSIEDAFIELVGEKK